MDPLKLETYAGNINLLHTENGAVTKQNAVAAPSRLDSY